jgi:hypothetical protein
MMQLAYLDYTAVEGKSWLHRLSPRVKLIGMFVVLGNVVVVRNLSGLLLLYALLLFLFLTSRVPIKIFSLTLYPLVFAFLFIFISSFQLNFILLIFLKVLCGSTGVVLLLATTPFLPCLWFLKVLPSLFVTALFLTSIDLHSPRFLKELWPSTCGEDSSGNILEEPRQYRQCLRSPDPQRDRCERANVRIDGPSRV